MYEDNLNERTEQPTPKRLKEAKERGQVPRSRDLNSWFVLFLGAVPFYLFGSFMLKKLKVIFTECLSLDYCALDINSSTLILKLKMAAQQGSLILLPFFVFILLAIIIGPLLFGSWTFTFNNISIKLERLNPINGLQKIFSGQSVFEVFKSLIKILTIIAFSCVIYKLFFNKIIFLPNLPLTSSLSYSFSILFWSFIILTSGIFFVCIFDVPYQIWQYRDQLMMTRQELKDEYRETEGKPEVKSKISRLQRQIAKRRMMAALKTSDVIITNPTHYAVALRYDAKKMKAPVVVAKGVDNLAYKIMEVGEKHKIPRVSLPTLARSIYYFTEVDHEIPSKLYIAVAQVLGYVHQLKLFKKGKMKKPRLPSAIDIPQDMKR